MATLDFIYSYPYVGFGTTGRFRAQWSESQMKLNGSYTYPMVFNSTLPGCKHMKISIEIENTGYGTVFDRSWDFMVRTTSGSWIDIQTFTLPDTGLYTVDCDIGNLNITMFAFVPSSNPGSSRSWDSWFEIEEIIITEKMDINHLETGNFFCGIMANRRGTEKELCQVYVNVASKLVQAKNITININGELQNTQPVYSAHHYSESESMIIFAFTPDTSGTYKIQQKNISGDHELRLYSSDFTPLYDDYFYNQSFELIAGALYYISVTHYRNADISESYLQIYKEA